MTKDNLSLKVEKTMHTNKHIYTCRFCKKIYFVSPSRNTTFCCRDCMFKSRVGIKRSAEIGQRITLAKLHGTNPSDGRSLRKRALYKQSRNEALLRDSFTCQICFEPGLDTHHIRPIKEYPELAFEVDNLVTLCKECHDTEVSRHEKEWEREFLKLRLVLPVSNTQGGD